MAGSLCQSGEIALKQLKTYGAIRFAIAPYWLVFSLVTVALIGATAFIYYVGTALSAAALHPVGEPPADLHAIPVEFNDLRGWFVPANSSTSCVVLMHGVRADRRSMLSRAYMLRKAGYASLLFDFQAHGESPGKTITFGFLESANARSAVDFARMKLGCTKVAAIGQSLGGAAALLGDTPLNVQALIIESVYPSIDTAIADRLSLRLGSVGALFTPLLTLQLKYRLGIAPSSLRPIDKISQFQHPIFVIAGTDDLHTRLGESRTLFAAAQEPKQFWAVAGARHVDLYSFNPESYKGQVLPFLAKYLAK